MMITDLEIIAAGFQDKELPVCPGCNKPILSIMTEYEVNGKRSRIKLELESDLKFHHSVPPDKRNTIKIECGFCGFEWIGVSNESSFREKWFFGGCLEDHV